MGSYPGLRLNRLHRAKSGLRALAREAPGGDGYGAARNGPTATRAP